MRFFIITLLLIFSLSGQMVVRCNVNSMQQIESILGKGKLDIASGKYGEYYDLVVNPLQYRYLVNNGVDVEILIKDLAERKEEVRQGYHSYSEVNQILRNHAQNHPNICKLDSLGESYEGREIYCLKLSDNPNTEDPNEPDILFDALHHAREWATIEIVLFYADTLTSGYNVDPVITDLIDNNEIWLVPIVNVDGYCYDYPGQNMWRKNREPYGGAIGTDPNRNYNGVCGPEPVDAWGYIPYYYYTTVTHYPSSDLFCGAYGHSADCDERLAELIRIHNFSAHITYHSYAEEILWPWAHKSGGTPDASLYQQLANTMASLIQKVYGGNYDASGVMYPVSGSTDGWAYGYHHYIGGQKCLSYTIEVGTEFYEPIGHLNSIVHENWEGALFFAGMADSIRNNVVSEVPAATIAPMDTIYTADYTVAWSALADEWNHPGYWQLDEIEDYSYKTDDLESGTSLWVLDGFSLSTSRYHSATHSFYSGSDNNVSNMARTKYRYLVKPGDQLTFWCWYNLETNYDVAVVEVSTDDREWFQLDNRYTSSSGWTQKSYSLDQWEGKWIYIRFRMMTDGNTLGEGFYVDDIALVPEYGSITTLSNSIADTFYDITNQPNGHYYYRVRGHNSRGWGRYSQIEDVEIQLKVAEQPKSIRFGYQFLRNPSSEPVIKFTIPTGEEARLRVNDVLGRKAEERIITQSGHHKITGLPNGIYFLEIKYRDQQSREKVVIVH